MYVRKITNIILLIDGSEFPWTEKESSGSALYIGYIHPGLEISRTKLE